MLKEIPDSFYFYYLDEPEYLHKADKVDDDSYLITPNAVEEQEPFEISIRDVQRKLNNNLWFIDHKEPCTTCDEDIFQSIYDNKWYMRIENGGWDVYNDCPDYTDIVVHYCCSCGRKYD